MPVFQMESLEEAAMVHGLDVDVLVNQINDFSWRIISLKGNHMTDYDNCGLLFTHHYVTENGVNSNNCGIVID